MRPVTARALAEGQLRPLLQMIPNLTEVRLFGGATKTTVVELDPARLSAVGASILGGGGVEGDAGRADAASAGVDRSARFTERGQRRASRRGATLRVTEASWVRVRGEISRRPRRGSGRCDHAEVFEKGGFGRGGGCGAALGAAGRAHRRSGPNGVSLPLHATAVEVSVETPPGINEERRVMLVTRVARALETTLLGSTYSRGRDGEPSLVVLVLSKPIAPGAARRMIQAAVAPVPAVRTRVTVRCGAASCAGADAATELLLIGPDLDTLSSLSAKPHRGALLAVARSERADRARSADGPRACGADRSSGEDPPSQWRARGAALDPLHGQRASGCGGGGACGRVRD